jgi:outer membrane protein OmpA-like peptidoglycan-associated protein
MRRLRNHSIFSGPLALVLAFSLTAMGCGSLSNTEKGAAGGAAGGAVVGGAAGKATGAGTAKGAIIGAVVGGAAGAVIGNEMDKQEKEIEKEVEGAEVERVAEGIQVTFDNAILFGFDSAKLQPAARENLGELAENLRKYEGKRELVIVGHTDAVGSESYNQDLSERRASSAADYLIGEGVSPDMVTTVGKGELEPVASNETAYGRQQNRRVEIAIYASEEYREKVKERTG